LVLEAKQKVHPEEWEREDLADHAAADLEAVWVDADSAAGRAEMYSSVEADQPTGVTI